MKKVWISFMLMAALVITGCSSGKDNQSASSETSTSVSETSETTNSSSVSQTTQESETGDNSSTAVSGNTSNSSTSTGTNFPYTVDVNALGNSAVFYYGNSVNFPTSFTLENLASRQPVVTVTYDLSDGTSDITKYQGTVEEIPTKEIRVFSASTSSNNIRSVSVNTRINLDTRLEGTRNLQEGDSNGAMYLFVNNNGGYSLVTPNYAGNVPDENRDVMQEVLMQ